MNLEQKRLVYQIKLFFKALLLSICLVFKHSYNIKSFVWTVHWLNRPKYSNF